MSNVRRIPTAMTSATHLVAALEQSGLRDIERVSELAPLISWRGQQLPERAEIIVRRRQIGATADDLGFVRGADGRYEALLSEILLSRFDKRWFSELEKRYAALAASNSAPSSDTPSAELPPQVELPPEFAPPRSEPWPARSEPQRGRKPEPSFEPKREPKHEARPERSMRPPVAPLPPRGVIEVDRVELPATDTMEAASGDLAKVEADLVAVLGAAKRAGGGAGCAKHVLLFVLFYGFSTFMGQPAVLVLGIVGLVFYAIRDLKQRKERMVQAATAEFRSRFGSSAQARELALQRLRREIGKLDGDKRAVVEQLLRRLT